MNRRPRSPSFLVDGYSVLRAITRAVLLQAEPPGCEIPPAKGVVKPRRVARNLVVCFSIRVRTGETWYTCAWFWSVAYSVEVGKGYVRLC